MSSIKSRLKSLRKKGLSSSHSPAVSANTVLPADTSQDRQQNEAAVLTNVQQPAQVEHPYSTAINRTEKYGLFPLSLPATPSDDVTVEGNCSVDIVAVHGINGDAYKTWIEGEKLWLCDFLPKDLPGSRIFSYGYPAEVFCSLSTGNLDSYSRSLLEALKRERRQEGVSLPSKQVLCCWVSNIACMCTANLTSLQDQRRAIIFICHSMGGIVVKKV